MAAPPPPSPPPPPTLGVTPPSSSAAESGLASLLSSFYARSSAASGGPPPPTSSAVSNSTPRRRLSSGPVGFPGLPGLPPPPTSPASPQAASAAAPPPLMRIPSLSIQCADESMAKYVKKNLMCAICISMVYEPYQTACSHLFCAGCIRPALQHKNQCPSCRTSLIGKAPEPLATANPAFYRFISDIEVKCHLNAINGCTWVGPFSEMDNHTKKRCEYAPIDCEYCNDAHPRGKMNQHHQECLKRPVKCEECKNEVPFSQMTEHKSNQCSEGKVECAAFTLPPDAEVKGCGGTFKRGELLEHQKSSCPNTIIACPYAELGCITTRFPRSQLAEHDNTHTSQHMKLMAKLVTEVSTLRKQVASNAAAAATAPAKSATTSVVAAPPPQIYVFGGHCGDKKVVHTSERWTNGKWETIPPMPTARKLVQAARVGDFIYVVGGDDTQGADMDVVERLHVPTLTWFSCPSLPSARSCHCVAAVGRSVFSIGGHVDQRPGSNQVDELVEGATQWVSAPPMINGRMYATSVVHENKIYMFGGSPNLQVSGAQPLAEVFDPATRRWSSIANMPRARANARAVVVEGKILLMGGGTPSPDGKSNDITDTMDEYDPVANRWRAVPIRMATPRAGFAVVYCKEAQSLVIAMGEPSSIASSTHVRMLPLLPTGTGANNSGWGMAPTATQGRLSFAWWATPAS